MPRMNLHAKRALMIGLWTAVLALIAGCGETWCMAGSSEPEPMSSIAPVAKDGELQIPADYGSWPIFLTNIDKKQSKQVRDIYINPTGAKGSAGKGFASGTLLVMELYKAKENPDGTLQKTPKGRLIKGDLFKVYIMGKDEGWGGDQPDNLKNGAWIYSAYGPDGKPLAEDFSKCRACHVPLAAKDFVFRYDEYFEKRRKM